MYIDSNTTYLFIHSLFVLCTFDYL